MVDLHSRHKPLQILVLSIKAIIFILSACTIKFADFLNKDLTNFKDNIVIIFYLSFKYLYNFTKKLDCVHFSQYMQLHVH